MKQPDLLTAARIGLALMAKLPLRADCGHVVLVTSASAGEGKSFVSDLLARELARPGAGDVALIGVGEANASAALPTTGFAGLVATGSLDPTCLRPGDAAGLILVRPEPGTPGSLLFRSTDVAHALDTLRKRFRLSLIDGPTLVHCGALLQQADAVLLVVDSRATSPQTIRRAMATASIGASDIDAAVLNRAPQPVPSWLGTA